MPVLPASIRGRPRRPGPARASASVESSGSTGSGSGVGSYKSSQDSPARSSVLAFPTNSRRELTPLTRREIIRKSRALEGNCPKLTRIIRKFARHAVGNGIHFRFLTPDRAWNDEARRLVEEWWNNPSVYSTCGTIDGWEAKRLAVEHILLDGEFNAIMAESPGGWPMLQTLDVFEIETPLGSGVDPTWDDGVKISSGLERPLTYSVRSLPRGNLPAPRYTQVPAGAMIHLFRRRRARGHRGLPAGYSGLNMGLDALDLEALITGTAKLHSGLAVQVKRTGKLNKSGAVGKIQNGGNATNDMDVAALEKVYGSMINYVGENGEIDLKSSSHPTVNQMEFMLMLFGEMADGFDLPKSVMFGMADVGGAGARFEVDDAQSSFDQLYDMIVWRFVRREIIWFIAKQIKSGRLAQPRDPYWYSHIVFRGPRKLTADIKGMAQSFKILARNGALSIPRWMEEQGLDAYEEARDNFEYLRFLKQMYQEGEVPVEWVYESTPGAAAATAPEPAEPDDPAPPRNNK